YRNFEQCERDELLANLIRDLAICHVDIQNAMIALAAEADVEYGRLLKEGLHKARKESSPSKPLGNIGGYSSPQDA
ncbi:catalase-related domain-containing protein, partial [Lysinibacillus sp. D4A3_S15]|uniref:catalase-related domain-containing protein n=1 Tax=Lysinibacillus sp. D4A3_S15 TaxID=2941227 RepID=UPI0037CA7C21